MTHPDGFLVKLFEIADDASLDELAAYLRHEERTSDAKWKLGAACKPERWEAWKRRRQQARVSDTPAPPPSGERVSIAELEAAARRR